VSKMSNQPKHPYIIQLLSQHQLVIGVLLRGGDSAIVSMR
jgi:hypothetical protein